MSRLLKLLSVAAFALIAFGAVEFDSTGKPTKEVGSVVRAIDSKLNMPPAVEALVMRSCADCHTPRTQWPWYANVPPVSWLVQRDVTAARKAMDLTNWSTKNGRTRGYAIGTLRAICPDVQSGRM